MKMVIQSNRYEYIDNHFMKILISFFDQVIKMLVAVVLFFIICWSPILIINILTSIGVISPLSYGYLKPLRTIAHLLSYVNSCINPIVYGLMSKNFRASFHAVLSSIPCFSIHKGNQQPNRSNSNYASSYRINSTQPTRATSVWTQR